ncbi:tRNA (uridine(54)-C5)-methyltransferase TrmA [uncultured Campylobacter sp.]|uniref:tRNA (uridine(54)-C5)-methyltransferase TrmA n=1 Tax=uncultured Campylobacter sp. TaxID=218934 RepID=UPI002605F6F4|nr:tRNA (uridine(54)-C5)-methyltransferase TrmA [uncultured Campylobacter sp.]
MSLCLKTLNEKIAYIKKLFEDFKEIQIQSFSSPTKSYRNKAEFAIFHKDDDIFYAMFDGKKKYIIKDFEIANDKIKTAMPTVLNALNSNKKLKEKLFAIEFLSTKFDISVTLLYHKNIDLIKKELENFSLELKLKIIARSKGKKLVFNGEILKQELDIFEKKYYYLYSNECFIQANTFINEKMIEWILTELKTQDKKDLLELYCGYGNFTIPLSFVFDNILATEVSKKNIEFALENCKLNNTKNINFARLSSEELNKAINKERSFFRLKNVNLDDFSFSHILVDPPRAGLSKDVVNLVKKYENIIYVSCNPKSLKDNIKDIDTHELKKLAIFDQFANTEHIECIAILKKKGF